jgi:hypothetical protein
LIFSTQDTQLHLSVLLQSDAPCYTMGKHEAPS